MTKTVTMTDDLGLLGKTALLQMNVSIDRSRRVLELRAERDRMAEELSRVSAALAVEEADLKHEGALVDELLTRWSRVMDARFAEAPDA